MSAPSGEAAPAAVPLGMFVFKVASRCNLNCEYCYVYNKGDTTWRSKPALMSDAVFTATLERIRRHCELTGQRALQLGFHGGEPTLMGIGRFERWCGQIKDTLAGVDVEMKLQTNATRIGVEWAEAFKRHGVNVGVSMDGPRAIHDRFRVDHRGRGSYDAVIGGLRLLQEWEVPFGILSVIPLGEDPLAVHRHFLELCPRWLNYLLPDCTHDSVGELRRRHGPTPCADFLIPIFDEWLAAGPDSVRVADFWNISRILLGGDSSIENLGNAPSRYVFIESNGDIEGLDVLRVCGEDLTKTGYNVMSADFADIVPDSSLPARVIFKGMPLPRRCRPCPEHATCAGGYVPHRYSAARGFDNPSAWCADLLKLFRHARARLGVTSEETGDRRARLRRLSGVAV